jgi:hypothetical protein
MLPGGSNDRDDELRAAITDVADAVARLTELVRARGLPLEAAAGLVMGAAGGAMAVKL